MPASLDHDDVSGASHSDSATLSERLGIYRIESMLGRGGMGEVYLAWDEVLERHVAIKRIRSDRLGNAVQQARFLREARAVARLDHPNVVRIHHVLETDESSCLVMEFVRGQDFSKLPLGTMPLARTLRLAREVAEGLAAAHAQGLVHRDLKCPNVMSATDGGVKILDFGLATIREEEEAKKDADSDKLTGSNVLVGTAYAMSPEQILRGKVDHRSDLFSFGSLLYQMLAGFPPFQARSAMRTLHKVVKSQPEPLEVVVPDLPQAVASLVSELLSKDPESRPPSADAVVERLSRILGILPSGEVYDPASARTGPAFAEADTPTSDTPAGQVSPRSEDLSPEGPVVRTLVGLRWSDSVPADWHDSPPAFLVDAARRFDGRVVPGRPLVLFFRRPADAAAFALAFHTTLADQTLSGQAAAAVGLGIHLGEVDPALFHDTAALGDGHQLVEAEALSLVSQLARQASDGQTLLGRAAFDLARRARVPASLTAPDVRWMAHGAYLQEGHDEPIEVFEVGRDGVAPLRTPEDGPSLRRSVGLSEEMALGWRPAAGQPVPRRANWRLVERLGEGGFGEVWLARRIALDEGVAEEPRDEERVFKFCFEPDRLRALKREVTLFRLLRETLGHRDDIARVLDWDFDEVPYFLESEYTEGGDLVRWSERQGGLETVPLKIRLELVAEVAEALAAAHSVGVLHKDVKPQNVLVGPRADGTPQARLTDFGIGRLTDRERLLQPGFTVLGFTEQTLDDESSTGGTLQYMAPELHTGQPATIQADVFSLGVLLYQCVVGDLERPLALGWNRQIDDDLLAEDIALCVDGDPDRRLPGAAELAERLRTLEERRAAREAEQAAEEAQKRSQRRRKLLARLGAVAAVLLVVISVFALQTAKARDREQQARQQAEARRQQAETLIDFLLGDLRQELQPIGKLDILGQVGDQAMEYFAAVPDEELSPEELANYAKALHQIGQVRFNLGDVSEAAESFQRSLDMAKELAASDPGNAEWQFELGQSHFWVGFLRWQERDLDAALREFEAYREISEALVERDPSNATWRLELAYSYSNVGQIQEEQGRLDAASATLESSAQILVELVTNTPDDLFLSGELAQVYAKLGVVLRGQGRIRDAAHRLRESIRLFEILRTSSPDDLDLAHSLSRVSSQLGKTLLFLGEEPAAVRQMQFAADLSKALVEHEGTHRSWQADLAQDLDSLARVEVLMGRLDDAERHLREGLQILDSLLQEDPSREDWRLLMSRNHVLSAQRLRATGQLEASAELLDQALGELDRLESGGATLEYRLWLILGQLERGLLSRRQGQHEAASQVWHQALSSAEGLVASEDSPEHIDLLVRCLTATGETGRTKDWLDRLREMDYVHPGLLHFLGLFKEE